MWLIFFTFEKGMNIIYWGNKRKEKSLKYPANGANVNAIMLRTYLIQTEKLCQYMSKPRKLGIQISQCERVVIDDCDWLTVENVRNRAVNLHTENIYSVSDTAKQIILYKLK